MILVCAHSGGGCSGGGSDIGSVDGSVWDTTTKKNIYIQFHKKT